MELTYLGAFGSIAIFVAAMQLQSYYLYQKGKRSGAAIGIAAPSYDTVMLFLSGG